VIEKKTIKDVLDIKILPEGLEAPKSLQILIEKGEEYAGKTEGSDNKRTED